MASNKKAIQYKISDAVFERFPGYVRGVVLATDVHNQPSPAEIRQMLREAESRIRSQLDGRDLTSLPHIAAWREAYRELGIKPTEFRPSMEAMMRRVLNGHELPSINALVDIGNIISLRHWLPVGGHAIDNLTDDMVLRPASGEEVFMPFGSDQVEHPEKGEFIFCEGSTVLTRRWTWRQSNHTITTIETKNIEFNVDALPPVSIEDAEKACQEIADLVRKFCGGETRIFRLAKGQASIRII